jgi:hypothetical protein
MAIRVDGGPVPVAYFHFDSGQSFSEGQTVIQGRVLGQLKYGAFSGTNCGWGSQQSNEYHLHFVFLPTSSGYLEIGGCVLDLSTQNFVCNSNTYSPLSYIPNGGGNSPIVPTSTPGPSPTPGGPTPNPNLNPNPPGGTTSAGGGAHIWDGIVSAIVQLSTNTLNQYLPAQHPLFGYVMEKMSLVIQALLSIFMAIYITGISGQFLLTFIIAIIYLELQYLAAVVVFFVAPYLKLSL